MNFKAFTLDQLQAARFLAAQFEQRCIDAVKRGDFTINGDVASYCAKLEASIAKTLSGANDGNFTIRQRMEYILTGQCTPFLSPNKPNEE